MATLQELTVAIGVDADQLESGLTQATSGLDGLESGFASAEGAVDDFLGSFGAIGRVAGAVGTLATAIGLDEIPGMAMDAARTISSTEASLTGMYGSAEQAGDMVGYINDQFGGTRVGSEAFQDMAVQLGYMGIEGEAAQSVMHGVADAVEFAGGTSTNVESISGALINAQNSGTVFNDTLNQISANGVPIFEALEEQLDVTDGSIKDMASNGEISFDDLMATMENLSGDSMDKVNAGIEEVRGTWDYQWDAMKSATALALGEILNSVMQTEAMGDIFGGVSAAMEAVPDVLERIGDVLVSLGIIDALVDISDSLGDLAEFALPLATGFFGGFIGVIAGGLQVFSALAEAFAWVSQYLGFMEGPLTVVGGLLGGLIAAALMVSAVVKTMALAMALWSTVTSAWTVVTKAATLAKLAFSAALWASPITWIVAAIIALIAVIALLVYYWDDVAAAVGAAWEWITQATSTATAVVSALISAMVEWVLSTLAGWAASLASVVSGAWSAVTSLFSSAASAAMGLVSGMVSGVISLIAGLASLPGMVGGYFSGMVSTAAGQISSLISQAAQIPGRIMSAVGNLGSLLVNAGRNVIQGLISGITSMIGRVGSAMSNVASTIRGYLPFSPAEVGPMSGSGAPEVSGARIAETLGEGIMSELAEIDRAADALMSPLDDRVHAMQGAAGHIPANMNAASSRVEGREQRVVIDVTGTDGEMKKLIRKMVRTDGRGDVQSAFGR